MSPSKARAAAVSAAVAAVAGSSTGMPVHFFYTLGLYYDLSRCLEDAYSHTFCISHLPDPERRYAGLLRTNTQLAKAKVAMPNVLDSQGVEIRPADYDAKCSDGQFVEVEVCPEL